MIVKPTASKTAQIVERILTNPVVSLDLQKEIKIVEWVERLDKERYERLKEREVRT